MLSRTPIAIAAFMRVSGTPTWGQTLAQTAAYIITGGIVEVKDMITVDDETVQVPSFMVGLTTLMPAMTVHVTNRETCEILYEPVKRGQDKMLIYFNNVIPGETRDQAAGSNRLQDFSTFYLVGEDQVFCVVSSNGRSCLRTLDTVATTQTLPRIYRAIDHLFSTYCKPARRKGAF